MAQMTLEDAVKFAAQRHAAGDAGVAEKMYRQILQYAPQRIDIQHALAVLLMQTGRAADGVEMVCKVIANPPGFPGAHNSLGLGLDLLGRTSEAEAAFREGLSREPRHAPMLNNLGTVLREMGRIDEAIAAFEQALQVQPKLETALVNLAFTIQFQPKATGPEILHHARRWQAALGGEIKKNTQPFANVPSPNKRLKIGYVSPYFRDHCQALFMLPLLQHHNRADVEIFCYSACAVKDAITERHRNHADTWRDTIAMNDQSLADQIRADGIDILVDLAMHMTQGRPGLFTRRAAPVQTAWLAYPGTTGLSEMDWRITDVHLDPPGEHDQWYAERSCRLPDTFWCYDPLTDATELNAFPAQSAGRITFGCLNNFCKVNAETVELWGRVMECTPNSRLLLMSPQGPHRQKVIDTLRNRGQVEFVERRPRAEYLQLYQQIDICLDTFPYNGHTTSLDSYWMGVPVVSIKGDIAPARAGFGQLNNLALPELCGENETEFVDIAAKLAADLDRLASLRTQLRPRLQSSPLMDAKRFARNIEAAYRGMWHDWCTKPKIPQ